MTSSVTMHFAHANGFPAGSYQQLFNQLPPSWNILAKSQFGHEERLPVNSNWLNQARELHEYIENTSGGEKVYAVGHSFGAVISFMAACLYPDCFKGLILIDPPLVMGPKSLLVRLAKRTAYIDKLTPAKLAENRNTRWSLDDDLVAYFKSKALFKNMQPECVADYVQSAITIDGQHKTLTFDAGVEASIFRNLPHNLNKYKDKLRCPALLITGNDSNVCREEHWQRLISDNAIAHQSLPGGHMLPLEHPQALAAKVAETITDWENKKAG